MMRWSTTSLVARDATMESVPLDIVRGQVRSTVPTENELLRRYRAAAEQIFEMHYGQALRKSTRKATYMGWPCSSIDWDSIPRTAAVNPPWSAVDSDYLLLPYPPMISLDAVRYYDPDGALQTLASPSSRLLLLAGDRRRVRIYQAPSSEALPSLQARPDAVTIEYTAGYASSDAVPHDLQQGLLWLIAWMWLTRNPASYEGQQLPRPVRDAWAAYQSPSV